MKEVTAYQDSQGVLHKTEIAAAIAELQILSIPDGAMGEPIGGDNAAKLVANRRAVISALTSIDAPKRERVYLGSGDS